MIPSSDATKQIKPTKIDKDDGVLSQCDRNRQKNTARKVATYGQIARLAGKPQGARGVGWILNSSSESHGLPWQRVINSQGRISFGRKSSAYTEQRQLLLKEGVQFVEHGSLDLAVYQWKKQPAKSRKRANTPALFRSS